ncbi:hypothetical protein HJFPF1_11006 [Paramyrothecium foliicola]|nr:hypothetical protein HJFPF1_11006 [Paramyrothecium foliicola]
MAHFTVFPNLPGELQDAIWALAMPDPQPEVCVVSPLVLDASKNEKPRLPFMVDTAWPTVSHVCRDARASVLRSGALRLRESSTAGFAVPCRAFDPALDTLYWSHVQADSMVAFLNQPENAALARSLHHVAIEMPAIFPPKTMAELIRRRLVFLRTLSLVLPDQSEGFSLRTAFIPPARRCRLRDLPAASAQNITVSDAPFLDLHTSQGLNLPEFLEWRRADLDDYARKVNLLGNEGTAWSAREECLAGLELKVQTFIEYTAGVWGEVCGHRKLGDRGLVTEKAFSRPAPRKKAPRVSVFQR